MTLTVRQAYLTLLQSASLPDPIPQDCIAAVNKRYMKGHQMRARHGTGGENGRIVIAACFLCQYTLLTRDVFTQADIARTALLFGRTSFHSLYGSRGGLVLIRDKTILSSLAIITPLVGCFSLTSSGTSGNLTDFLALLGSQEV